MAGSEGSGDEKKYRKKQKSGSRDRRNDSEESGDEYKSKDKKHKEKKGGKYSGGESGDEDKKYKKEKKSKDKGDVSEDEDEGHSGKKDKKDKKDKKHKEGQSEEEDGGDGDYKKKKEKDKGKDKEKKRDDEEGSEKKDKDKKSKSEGSHSEHKLTAGASGLGEIGKIPGVGETAAKVASVFASSEAWIEAAKKTTADFKASGPKSPTTWILVEGNNIVADAIRAGEDKTGVPFYVARAFYEGALHIGRASKNGAFIGHSGREISVPLYEVLLGDSRAIRWVPAKSGPTGVRPVEGGIDSSGKPIMIAQTMYGGEVIPGKAMDWVNGALVALGGQEINVKDYNILAYT